ncbi:MAG: hypothetical protein HY064_16900 [Bacteroidetes bacterium]|nr:hypothetical protein [Bacteroidota bacterium]
MKKILIISLWSLLGIGLITAMTFAGKAHLHRVCPKVNIVIDRKCSDIFLDEDHVLKLLSDHHANPVGKQIADIDVPAIEKLMLNHPAVESGEVFMDVDGTLNIHLHQRKAVARILTSSGESYYFDDRGFLMPLSDECTAPVLLFNGNFNDTYASAYETPFDKSDPDSVFETPTKLDDIWQITKKLQEDSLLRSQIVQVYFTNEKGFELVPRIGKQIIILGDVNELGEKLKKLDVFYREGMVRTGKWNEYSVINLEYKNQVVCTKK